MITIDNHPICWIKAVKAVMQVLFAILPISFACFSLLSGHVSSKQGLAWRFLGSGVFAWGNLDHY